MASLSGSFFESAPAEMRQKVGIVSRSSEANKKVCCEVVGPSNIERRDRLELRYSTTVSDFGDGGVVPCVNRNQFAGGFKTVGSEEKILPGDYGKICKDYWLHMHR
jgi:hypothetical protein